MGGIGLDTATKLPGSKTSRFGKHSVAKSLRFAHRHKVPRESLTIRHENQTVLVAVLFLSRLSSGLFKKEVDFILKINYY